MIGFIDILHKPDGTTGNYGANADLHTSQFTFTHALGFSVFTSRILATDLQQSQCHFKSHTKSSFHSPIPFLPLFFNCQFFCSQAHIPAGWRLETRLNWTVLHNHFARTMQKPQPLYGCEGVFTAPLNSNGSYSIVACVFVFGGMCLSSRCVTMNVNSDFIILAFGRHVTVLSSLLLSTSLIILSLHEAFSFDLSSVPNM
jgi:hypothetical protein